ncbi:MAG: squalene/phytoene synthase family protein, partial [Halospina sp.]
LTGILSFYFHRTYGLVNTKQVLKVLMSISVLLSLFTFLIGLGVRELLSRAEAYYASGWQGLWYLPARPRIAIAVAARLYREIGRQILRRGEAAYWQHRSVVGPLRKIQVSLSAVVRLALIPPHNTASGHDALLHRDLSTYPGANQRDRYPAAASEQRAERGYGG